MDSGSEFGFLFVIQVFLFGSWTLLRTVLPEMVFFDGLAWCRSSGFHGLEELNSIFSDHDGDASLTSFPETEWHQTAQY